MLEGQRVCCYWCTHVIFLLPFHRCRVEGRCEYRSLAFCNDGFVRTILYHIPKSNEEFLIDFSLVWYFFVQSVASSPGLTNWMFSSFSSIYFPSPWYALPCALSRFFLGWESIDGRTRTLDPYQSLLVYKMEMGKGSVELHRITDFLGSFFRNIADDLSIQVFFSSWTTPTLTSATRFMNSNTSRYGTMNIELLVKHSHAQPKSETWWPWALECSVKGKARKKIADATAQQPKSGPSLKLIVGIPVDVLRDPEVGTLLFVFFLLTQLGYPNTLN